MTDDPNCDEYWDDEYRTIDNGPNASAPGFHRHKCDRCGYVWEHNDECRNSDSAHTCAKCGAEQFWKYFGDDRPKHSEYCVAPPPPPLPSIILDVWDDYDDCPF